MLSGILAKNNVEAALKVVIGICSCKLKLGFEKIKTKRYKNVGIIFYNK